MGGQNLHKILLRQISRYLGDSTNLDPQVIELLQAVSETYYHYDEDRTLIERSLEISSSELTAINRDIEEKIRRRTEQLVNQQRTLETLLDNLPVGVFVAKAPSGEPFMINRKGKEILGRGVEPGINSANYALVYQAIKEDGTLYPNEELPLNITLREAKAAQKDDVIIQRPDGYKVALRITSAPIRDIDGYVRTAVAVFEDINKERELERSRDEFFSIASHELRTPLTAIRGNTDLIRQYYPQILKDQTLNEMIGDIHESSIRLIMIVNDFLDTSRLEQKKMNFSFSNFDIEKMAHDAIRQYQVTSSRKRILLEVHDPGKPMPPVHADQDRTRQVLINLIGNALKFTEHGVVTVSFSTDGNFVKVSVSDSGKGIPYDAQERLFRKFEQAGSTVLTRDSVRGTGLGLYISKMIMEQMKGSIRLESSTPGVGTTFSFSLPIAGGDKTAHASSTQTET